MEVQSQARSGSSAAPSPYMEVESSPVGAVRDSSGSKDVVEAEEEESKGKKRKRRDTGDKKKEGSKSKKKKHKHKESAGEEGRIMMIIASPNSAIR